MPEKKYDSEPDAPLSLSAFRHPGIIEFGWRGPDLGLQQIRHRAAGPVWRQLRQRLAEIVDIAGRLPGPEGQAALVDEIKNLGSLLYHNLVPDKVKELIAASARGLHLFLDWQTAAIPWEFLWDGRRFLAQAAPLTRQISLFRSAMAPATRARNVLVVADSAQGQLPAAEDEARAIMALYEKHGVPADLIGEDARRSELLALVASHGIVHYAGHQDTESSRPGWRCADGLFSGRHFSALDRVPKLLFSNSCGGARLSPSSLAYAVLERGVGSFVGPVWKVPDHAARDMALNFHRALLEGETLARALFKVRRRQSGQAAWAGYVIYAPPEIGLRDLL